MGTISLRLSDNMHKKTGILLLIAGLVMGPGYYVYARFFSGILVATQAMQVRAEDGVQRFQPVSLKLAPDMQPAGLVLRFQVSHGATISPPNTPRNDYRARLLDGERIVLDQRFSLQSTLVESTPSLQFQQSLAVPAVDRAAEYQLELQLEGEPDMQVLSADVQVRAHMREPDFTLVYAGAAIAAAGLLSILF